MKNTFFKLKFFNYESYQHLSPSHYIKNKTRNTLKFEHVILKLGDFNNNNIM